MLHRAYPARWARFPKAVLQQSRQIPHHLSDSDHLTGGCARRCGRGPFRNLLVVVETHPLQGEASKDVVQADVARGQSRKTRSDLGHKPLRKSATSIAHIATPPPIEDPLPGTSERRITRQPIAFFALIDVTVCRHQVPKVVAGPGSPREAVIDVKAAR